MTETASWRWVADLGLAAAVAILAVVAVLVPAVPWPIRWTLGIALLVFVPGYAVAAAVFPERRGLGSDQSNPSAGTPPWAVVFGLAILGSALLSAVVGTAFLLFAELTLVPVAIALALLTIVAGVVAGVRRMLLAPYARRAPFRDGAFSNVTLPGGRRQNAAFAAAIVLLVAAVGMSAAFPPAGEAYTEFYVLDENADGELVAEGYPTEVVAGEGHTFHLALANHEHERTTYTVVVVAQDVSNGAVTAQRQLDTVEVTLGAGENRTVAHDVVPEQTGEDVRIQFLLYKGDAPASPSANSAAITLQIWTDVVPATNASATVIPGTNAPTLVAAAPR